MDENTPPVEAVKGQEGNSSVSVGPRIPNELSNSRSSSSPAVLKKKSSPIRPATATPTKTSVNNTGLTHGHQALTQIFTSPHRAQTLSATSSSTEGGLVLESSQTRAQQQPPQPLYDVKSYEGTETSGNRAHGRTLSGQARALEAALASPPPHSGGVSSLASLTSLSPALGGAIGAAKASYSPDNYQSSPRAGGQTGNTPAVTVSVTGDRIGLQMLFDSLHITGLELDNPNNPNNPHSVVDPLASMSTRQAAELGITPLPHPHTHTHTHIHAHTPGLSGLLW